MQDLSEKYYPSKMASYRSIKDFGKIRSTSADPWSYCAIQGPDMRFAHPPLGSTHGAHSQNCQAWMAEECAKDWSEMCEYVYQTQNSTSFPNTLNVNQGVSRVNTNTAGQNLLANSVERAFCSYSNCVPIKQPFDPTVADSPPFTTYVSADGDNGNCVPVCSANPETVDNDPLIQKMIQNPEVCSTTITNIFNTAMREGISYEGTCLHEYQQIHARAVAEQQQAIQKAALSQKASRNNNSGCF
jgi:hypothetical protein